MGERTRMSFFRLVRLVVDVGGEVAAVAQGVRLGRHAHDIVVVEEGRHVD